MKKYKIKTPKKKTLFIFFQVQNSEFQVMFILELKKKIEHDSC